MNAPTLTTRCSHCDTVFRVTAEQLRARAGQVRCGRCLQVFDALAALQPERGAAEPALAGASVADAPVAPALTPESAAPPGPTADTGEGATQAPADGASPPSAIGVQSAQFQPQPQPQPQPHEPLSALIPESAAAGDNPFMTPAAAAVPEPRHRVFALASLLLFLVLAGQVMYAYRGELAASHAVARAWITAACAAAGCMVTLPQRPQQVVIEGSDLEQTDPARPGQIRLTATLRNHAGHAIGFPALDLVLTGSSDHTLARRVFLPADYLPADVDRSAGLAAQAEMTLRLGLDTGDLGASGFRLAVLAAPP